MKRREFIAGMAGITAAWPLAGRAQNSHQRRIGMMLTFSTDESETAAGVATFRQGLQQAGWSEGSNLEIDIRWAEGDADRIRTNAAELVARAPDIMFAIGTANLGTLLQMSRTIPIVFAYVADPVGAGFVESLARPGGNATGFSQFEFGLSGKWVELLKEVAPSVTRVAVLRDSAISAGIGQFGAIQTVASTLGIDVSPVNVRDAGEIERAVVAFARSANGGLIVTASALSAVHGDLIIALAARHKLPAVYFLRRFISQGGLISYGPDIIDQYRRAAGYVDRVLRGEKPGDLPVQSPTKYAMAINTRTAKALGLNLPSTLLARADEVIE
jgi:putative tryptophan/tyrosine transport system substrate-binding protein